MVEERKGIEGIEDTGDRTAEKNVKTDRREGRRWR